jgi:hypothetical protein
VFEEVRFDLRAFWNFKFQEVGIDLCAF